VAGNETTRNAIAHGMNAFLEHPDQYELLASDPDRYIAGAVEEVLRWATPVLFFRRNVTHDLELGGKQLKEGDKVSLWYISGNRDEDVFEDPFRFDITRDPNPQVGFGGHGAHYCIGANLARQEIRLIFEALADHAPDITKLEEPRRLRHGWVNGLKDLQVKYAQ